MMIASAKSKSGRRGVVLLAVLVVIVLLFLAAYHYSDMMIAEYKASDNSHRAAEARAVADSGVHYAAALLSQPNNLANLLNGNPYHNDQYFSNVAIGNGTFFLVARNADEPTSYRPGVIDETGKININAVMKRDPSGEALYAMLNKLPIPVDNWSDIAAAIVDWVDTNSTPRTGGAENEYYMGKNPPYRCKNGPLDSIEELLLIKGIDENPWLLYGDDKNRNGVQDEDEIPQNGEFFPGLVAYLTIYSRETNLNEEGKALTNINDTDLSNLYSLLSTGVSDDLAKFVVLFRQYGSSTSTGANKTLIGSIASLVSPTPVPNGSTNTRQGKFSDYTPDFKKVPKENLTSLFDLVDTQVSVVKAEQVGNRTITTTTIYSSPLNDAGVRRELLPKLFAFASVFQETELAARVNVNTAPREVLMALPELSETDVETILTVRPSLDSGEAPDKIFQTPAWLMTEANLKAATLKKMESSFTTKTQVYRVQVIGQLSTQPKTSARVEAVIDANNGRPRILAWRDLGDWGQGLPANMK